MVSVEPRVTVSAEVHAPVIAGVDAQVVVPMNARVVVLVVAMDAQTSAQAVAVTVNTHVVPNVVPIVMELIIMDKMSVWVAAVTVVDVLLVFSHVKIPANHRSTQDIAITLELPVRILEQRTNMEPVSLDPLRFHLVRQPPLLILQN